MGALKEGPAVMQASRSAMSSWCKERMSSMFENSVWMISSEKLLSFSPFCRAFSSKYYSTEPNKTHFCAHILCSYLLN